MGPSARRAVVVGLACAVGCGKRPGEAPSLVWTCEETAVSEVSIDLDQEGTTPLRHGYVHGFADPDPDAAQARALFAAAKALGAKQWRVSDPYHLAFLKPLGVELTYVLMDGFSNYNNAATPWLPDFAAWDAYVTKAVNDNLAAGSPVSSFDVWGEPAISPKNQAEVLGIYRRSYAIIRANDPTVKVVAPCLWEFDEAIMTAFLDLAVANQQVFDAICWHDFSDDPKDLLTHAQRMRELLVERPSLGSPPLHVNEYNAELQHLVPAYNVEWLALLEEAGINVANRACWDRTQDAAGAYGNCWAGIEGVYLRDGVTPQPTFHVLAPYGQLTTKRYSVRSDDPGMAAVAGRDATSGTVTILTGYVAAPSKLGTRLALKLKGLSSASTLHFAVDRVPAPPTALDAVPLPAPLVGPTGEVPIESRAATIDLGCVPQGAALVVRLGE